MGDCLKEDEERMQRPLRSITCLTTEPSEEKNTNIKKRKNKADYYGVWCGGLRRVMIKEGKKIPQDVGRPSSSDKFLTARRRKLKEGSRAALGSEGEKRESSCGLIKPLALRHHLPRQCTVRTGGGRVQQ